jgi:catechol-2,3-dioxygenase
VGIKRLNHAVLYVRDVRRSTAFYLDVLGFSVVHELRGAAFLRAADSDNDHDLGLFEVGADAADSPAGRGSVGLYHLAWSVGTLEELAAVAGRLRAAGALVGASDHVTSKSLYGKDPDGIEFEVGWFVPRSHVTPEMAAESAVRPLDLEAEIARWGALAGAE